jgi:putative ABC transport system permease protein
MRTVVSVLGPAVGVLLVVFTVGLAHGMLHEHGRREANINAEILVRASGSIGMGGSDPWVLQVSQAQEMAKVEGVRAAVPLGQALDKSDGGFGQRFIDGVPFDEYSALTGITIREGSKPVVGEQVVVDPVWVKEHKGKGIGDTTQLFERDFKIVGIYEPAGGARMKIPLSTMQEQFGAPGRTTSILVGCKNPVEQDAVAARLKERFPEVQLIFTRDLPELYATGVPALGVFIKVVVGVSCAISMLVILLAMYTTVTERTRQIGVLKSLGMSKAKIAWVIEQEAIIVSVLGIIVGVVLTVGASLLIMRFTALQIEIEPRWIIISLLVGLVGGTLGALYPAVRAARQDPVEALSYE